MFRSKAPDTKWVPVLQVELKTERLVMAFRLLFDCTFIRAESEQNSSHRCATTDAGMVLGRAVNVAQLIGLRPERTMLKIRSI